MPFLSENQPDGLTRAERRCRRNRSSAYQLTVALILIAFGTLLFLDNVGLLPVQRIYEYWPIIFIVLGVAKLVLRPTIVGVLWSIFLISAGSVFLLVNLNILRIHNDGTWPLALLFIIFGFLALIKTVDRGSIRARQRRVPDFVRWGSTDVLNESVVLASVKRRVESTNFLGGEIHAVMGSIELDLRVAQLPAGAKSATVELECVMGSIKIRISESWRISVQAQGVLGNIEDKTIPPRIDRNQDTPTLVITGNAVMSSVELEN